MVTVTATLVIQHGATAPLPSAGDSLQNNIKSIKTTGQENNAHKINKYITSSDPELQ